jgi:hypothetical protein
MSVLLRVATASETAYILTFSMTNHSSQCTQYNATCSRYVHVDELRVTFFNPKDYDDQRRLCIAGPVRIFGDETSKTTFGGNKYVIAVRSEEFKHAWFNILFSAMK